MGERRRALEVLVTGDSVLPALEGLGARRLKDSDLRVVVTGAGGWLGMATLEMLHGLLGEAFHARVVCFGARERALRLRGGVETGQRSLFGLGELRPAPSVVLHLAFITQGPAMTLSAHDYAAANLALADGVLTNLERIGARSVFVASSGAVHLADPNGGAQSKGLYGWLKLQDEEAFDRWRRGGERTAVIGRVFNLAGPYINRRSTYALASFIADALADRPIEIRAAGLVYRSYTSIQELMSVVMGALTDAPGETVRFETAGEAEQEMGEIAHEVARVLKSGGEVRRPVIQSDAPVDRYIGDGAAYRTLSQSYGAPSPDFAAQIRQTADYMAAYPEG